MSQVLGNKNKIIDLAGLEPLVKALSLAVDNNSYTGNS